MIATIYHAIGLFAVLACLAACLIPAVDAFVSLNGPGRHHDDEPGDE